MFELLAEELAHLRQTLELAINLAVIGALMGVAWFVWQATKRS